jgi:hypothetical protein
VSSEIARGLDILELQPSQLLSPSEIAAAKQVRFDFLNVQDQQRLAWPANMVVARAYLDQLARSNGLETRRVWAARDELTRIEILIGAPRRDALRRLSTQLDSDAMRARDRAKVQMLAASLREQAKQIID